MLVRQPEFLREIIAFLQCNPKDFQVQQRKARENKDPGVTGGAQSRSPHSQDTTPDLVMADPGAHSQAHWFAGRQTQTHEQAHAHDSAAQVAGGLNVDHFSWQQHTAMTFCSPAAGGPGGIEHGVGYDQNHPIEDDIKADLEHDFQAIGEQEDAMADDHEMQQRFDADLSAVEAQEIGGQL